MHLHFGLALDDLYWPHLPQLYGRPALGGILVLGPQGFLQALEAHFGCGGHPSGMDYLRIETYRQALKRQLEARPDAFYRAAFEADQFATATDLLERRDELLLAGLSPSAKGEAPDRLAVLLDVEQYLDARFPQGFADRFLHAEGQVGKKTLPWASIELQEPWALLPAHWQRLFERLRQNGVALGQNARHGSALADPGSDLGHLQALLAGEAVPKRAPRQDASLLIVRAARETDASAALARCLAAAPDWRPLLLVPQRHRALDNALVQAGLPSLGIASPSLGRPLLQILKLVTAFLWEPADPYRIMEFVSLALKPLPDVEVDLPRPNADEASERRSLSAIIAEELAQAPGTLGERWRARVAAYFEALAKAGYSPEQVDAARQQYRFWFERRRYDMAASVPAGEAIALFDQLERWARQQYEEQKSSSLLVLAGQARRIADLLGLLPESEQQLSHLALERIVRTVYEPTPLSLRPAELGSLPVLHQPDALLAPTGDLLWWNFASREPNYFFSRWYRDEQDWLAGRGIQLSGPDAQNARLIWQRSLPVQWCGGRLVLVWPQKIDGEAVEPHPLLSDISVAFADWERLVWDIGAEPAPPAWWPPAAQAPARQPLPAGPSRNAPDHILLGQPMPQLASGETPSSLAHLLYRPHIWAFRRLRLRRSAILSITDEERIKGHLAHRFFEILLGEADVEQWEADAVGAWMRKHQDRLLRAEGANLLMYGREPERLAFLRDVERSAIRLLQLLRGNGWAVLAAERVVEGQLFGLPLRGRADLVLRRGEELAVLDLKWRGKNHYSSLIKNNADLQLALYSRLLAQETGAARIHTAYYIVGERQILARSAAAFAEVLPIGSADLSDAEAEAQLLAKIGQTLAWRQAQLAEGFIELRHARSAEALEDRYYAEGIDLLAMLELPSDDYAYDDYRSIILPFE